MEPKRYKPYFDKLYLIISLPTYALIIGITILALFTAPSALFFLVPVDIFVTFLLIAPFFGYAELRENTLFIKYGLILKKEIPYAKIRGAEIKRSFYSESMLSLKNSFEHVDVKYNSFDVTSVSVVTNEEFLEELKKRI